MLQLLNSFSRLDTAMVCVYNEPNIEPFSNKRYIFVFRLSCDMTFSNIDSSYTNQDRVTKLLGKLGRYIDLLIMSTSQLDAAENCTYYGPIYSRKAPKMCP